MKRQKSSCNDHFFNLHVPSLFSSACKYNMLIIKNYNVIVCWLNLGTGHNHVKLRYWATIISRAQRTGWWDRNPKVDIHTPSFITCTETSGLSPCSSLRKTSERHPSIEVSGTKSTRSWEWETRPIHRQRLKTWFA